MGNVLREALQSRKEGNHNRAAANPGQPAEEAAEQPGKEEPTR